MRAHQTKVDSILKMADAIEDMEKGAFNYLEAAQKATGLCRSTAIKWFRHGTGETLGRYGTTRTASHVLRLLVETDHKMGAIAKLAGLSSVNLSARVRSVYGMTPSQARREIKQEDLHRYMFPRLTREEIEEELEAYAQESKKKPKTLSGW